MNQAWVAPLNPGPPFQTQTSGNALASSTSLTAISPATYTAPGYSTLQAGQNLRMTAYGIYSTTSNPNLTLAFYYGGTGGVALWTTGAIASQSSVTNQTWYVEALLRVQTVGVSGTVVTVGHATGVVGQNPVIYPTTSASGGQATINTTTNSAIDICAQWGSNSASNTITCYAWIIESLA